MRHISQGANGKEDLKCCACNIALKRFKVCALWWGSSSHEHKQECVKATAKESWVLLPLCLHIASKLCLGLLILPSTTFVSSPSFFPMLNAFFPVPTLHHKFFMPLREGIDELTIFHVPDTNFSRRFYGVVWTFLAFGSRSRPCVITIK